jgi:hypothetical protein
MNARIPYLLLAVLCLGHAAPALAADRVKLAQGSQSSGRIT